MGYKKLTYCYYIRRYNGMTMKQVEEVAADAGIHMPVSTLRSLEMGSRRPQRTTLMAWCQIFGIDYLEAMKGVNGDIEIKRGQWKKLGITEELLMREFGKAKPKRKRVKLI